ncbi:Methyl-accepting chemotaxis protein [Hyella patelloides LEGE 07179]|uniref:Methyl-accepting chemotaxis protein n=1 Tax=Hyella patelloides LEGE 07179 TaxID=945734 RepID=A0A563VN32_9CYAN|nr:methyl-accepting chemotaxis protein [Hyella patelloides]VEP12743.1 Methyl-accepting chemotaxis protein [Hyella patelloides LEGE 07179]
MTKKPELTSSPSLLTSTTQSNPNQIKKVSPLRSRLLTTLLPTVLVPLFIASFIGDKTVEREAKTEIINELEEDTVLASQTFATFLRDSFKTMDLVIANPDVVPTLQAGNEQTEEQQLTQKSIEELEKQFATIKSLKTNEDLDRYLRKVVRYSPIAETYFTQRNGFNIAYSNPPDDFVQSDEDWWQTTKEERRSVLKTGFDDSIQTNVIELSDVVRNPRTGDFLGVLKSNVAVDSFNTDIDNLYGERKQDFQLQIIDLSNNFIITNLDYRDLESHARGHQVINSDHDENQTETSKMIGSEPIVQVAQTLLEVANKDLSLEKAQQLINQQASFSEVSLNVIQDQIFSETVVTALLRYQNQLYSFSTIPKTNFISLGVIDYQVIESTGDNLQKVFVLTAIILGIVSLLIILFLAQQITKPLINLSNTTQKAAAGNLDIQANLEGALETRTLANNFNYLVKQVKESIQSQKALAEEQRQGKEQLETAIVNLLDDVQDATDGDLTVRANLDSMELSTVADLFNAIIDNLQEIALEARQSTSQVEDSLKQNESAIRLLAEQAITEAEETRDTLISVEQMSQSIQAVAENANQAEKIVDDTYNTVLNSTSNMDLTVDSILTLRTTVGETAKKMKRLGESSQKISQAVSFIEDIALKTNILAINATVEAGRAGEYGEGFTIVAEQVAALAEQSATATKEIASIVATIQSETQEVNQAMESGTIQVVETTRLIESTKDSLELVLEKSQVINQLIESISQSTVSQADTSQNVTNLMQKIAQLSETTSKSSQEVAQSIVETAQVAAKLQSTVAQFKVVESA